MTLGRGLDFLLQDLDSRQRQGPVSKNQPLQKFAGVNDTVFATPDAVTTTVATPPYHWHDPAGTTATSLIFAASEWG